MNYFDQQGNLTEEGLMLYVEALKLDRLSEVPEKVLQYIHRHPEMERQAIELYSLIAEVDYKDLGPHPKLDKKIPSISRRRSILRWAAAASVALLAYYTYQLAPFQGNSPELSESDSRPVDTLKNNISNLEESDLVEIPPSKDPNAEPPEELQKQDDDTPSQDDRLIFAANFEQDEHLDGLIGLAVRGAELNILYPAIDNVILVGENINFAWQNKASEEEGLVFLLLNNRGATLVEAKTDSENYLVEQPLEPGIYYWKLETVDDLIYVGRFYIRSK